MKFLYKGREITKGDYSYIKLTELVDIDIKFITILNDFNPINDTLLLDCNITFSKYDLKSLLDFDLNFEVRKALAEYDGRYLRLLKEEEMTYEICYNAMISYKKFSRSQSTQIDIAHIPLQFRTSDLCYEYFNKRIEMVKAMYIPKESQDKRLLDLMCDTSSVIKVDNKFVHRFTLSYFREDLIETEHIMKFLKRRDISDLKRALTEGKIRLSDKVKFEYTLETGKDLEEELNEC